MSTIGVVALSLLLGAFIVCLIAMAGYLAWDGHRLRTLLLHDANAHESTRNQLTLLATDIRATLESHRAAMEIVLAKINGEKLAQASAEAIQASRRIETAAVAIGTLARALLSEDALSSTRDTGLGATDYAPETGERYTGVNRTAAGDQRDLSGEGEGEP